MATRSELFRYHQERSGPKKSKRPPRPPRNIPVDTSLPGVSAADRRVFVFVDTASGKPSSPQRRSRTAARLRRSRTMR